MLRSILVASLLLCACKDADPPVASKAPAPQASAPNAEPPPARTELPTLSRTGTVDAPSAGPVLAATPNGITLDGKPVIALRDGAIDPADLEGGVHGRKISKLTAQLSTLAKSAPPSTLSLSLDPRVSYDLLVDVLYSAKQKEAGWKHFALLVSAGGATRALPITLPESRAVRADDLIEDLMGAPAPVGGRSDHGPAGRVQVIENTGADQVLAKIQSAYLAGIKRCYRDELRQDPTRRGKLTLTVKVSPAGIAKGSTAEGLAAACTEKRMQAWRFPIFKDELGEPTSRTFAITLQLLPDDDDGAEKPEAEKPDPEKPEAEKPEAEKPEAEKPEPPLAQPPAHPVEPALRLTVTITAKELSLWSFSGLEGTLSNPKMTTPRSDAAAMTKLGDALREIAQRRWAGRPRPEDSLAIVLIADPATPMQTIAELIATVRATPDGQTLFPDVLLSSGFE